MTGQVGSLDDLLSALAALPLAQRKGPRPGSVAARRIGAWALPPLALAIIGIVAWTVGSDLGAIPGADLSNPRLGKLPAVTSGRSPVVWRHPPRVTSFGPAGSGGDGATQAPAAVDGNLSTVWHTQTYASNRFGGLKSGVGLLIDLGRRTPVGAVQILLTHPGATLEVRSGNAPPTSAADLHLIRLARGGRLRIRVSLRHTMDTRYWLVWLTRLPRSGDGYSEGIREIRLEQPRGR